MQTVNTYYQSYEHLKKFVEKHHYLFFEKANRSILIQVFCGICDENYLELVLNEISLLIPHAQIIGATTGGEIMNGTVSSLQTAISFSVFQYTDIQLAFAIQGDNSSFELGQSIAETLIRKRSKILILFSSGKSVSPDQMLDGVLSVNPRMPIAGGVAGDNFFNKQSYVFCNKRIIKCGVVGIVLNSERLSVHQHWHLCWQPIGKEMTITKAEGTRVYTIDNLPANEIYKKYLGADGKESIINSIFPLITEKNGIDIVKTPSLIHHDDSIEFLSEMREGEKVRFSYGHVDMILESVDKLLKEIQKQPVESIFVYSCTLRRGFLQESAEIETLPLQNIAATAGFFTHGEFYHIHDTNQLLNATMTTLVLSEREKQDQPIVNDFSEPGVQESQDTNSISSKDNVKSTTNIAILKALTNLVNTVTNELKERTAELEKVNEHVRYCSIHDSLTGLYNRGFYEEEMKRLDGNSRPLGILMCDVDGLKLINDTLGHKTGDVILKAAAGILKPCIGGSAIAARIGGDEFSALFPDCSRTSMETVCEQIREAVAGYNRISPHVPLSLSIGFSYSKSSWNKADILFKEADNAMYREKLHRSKSIRSDLVQTLLKALEARDIITEKHCSRLEKMVADFALYIGYSKSDSSDLQLFARFHDIGKVGIPDSILFKPEKLTPKEEKEMQRHCEIGYRIAESSTDMLPLADWILKHHEWWNGKGYPLGLKGEEIPLECRILSIIDTYDAMISDRPYRKALDENAAIEELKRYSGIQFDPILTEKFIGMVKAKLS